jgi:hypothetical protein
MAGPDETGGGRLIEIQRRRRRRLVARAVLVVLLLAAGAAGYFYFLRKQAVPLPPPAAEPEVAPSPPVTPELPPPPAPPAPAAPEPEAAEAPPLPSLDASDALVRELAGRLSARPELGAWLMPEGLIRRFVVAIANAAEGDVPRRELSFLAPKEPFRARETAEGLAMDPRSGDRYDAVAGVFASLDSEGTVALYRRLRPLVDQAWAELGRDDDFDDALVHAIAEVLRAPQLDGRPQLVFDVDRYVYADPALEGLSRVQKQVLRLGPENQRRVQAKLRALALALGTPEARLPETPRAEAGPPRE